MLKITRLPNVPVFRKNNDNGEVVKFGVGDSNSDGGKALQR